MPGAALRRSMAHLGLSQRLPLRNSLMPSRRHNWQTEAIWRALFAGPGSRVQGWGLNASFLGGPAAIVRQRRHVFDGLDRQAGGLQGGDGRLPARTGALDTDLDFL